MSVPKKVELKMPVLAVPNGLWGRIRLIEVFARRHLINLVII